MDHSASMEQKSQETAQHAVVVNDTHLSLNDEQAITPLASVEQHPKEQTLQVTEQHTVHLQISAQSIEKQIPNSSLNYIPKPNESTQSLEKSEVQYIELDTKALKNGSAAMLQQKPKKNQHHPSKSVPHALTSGSVTTSNVHTGAMSIHVDSSSSAISGTAKSVGSENMLSSQFRNCKKFTSNKDHNGRDFKG